MNIDELRKLNPNLTIHETSEPSLAKYARTLDPSPYRSLMQLADRVTEIDPESNHYVASMPELEADSSFSRLKLWFGGKSIQVGCCNGPNFLLNALEWHESPEIDMAVTDMLLLLGRRSDVASDGTYDAAKIECFYVPKNSVIELIPETLHYSPCKALSSGFKSIIVLPRETNHELSADEEAAVREEMRRASSLGKCNIQIRLLWMKDKWLIAHPETTKLVECGAFPGIKGNNIRVNYLT